MIPPAKHPERNIIRMQLRHNVMLKAMDEAEWGELEPMLSIVDRAKGDYLLHQGVPEMEQYFLIEGSLNARGRQCRRQGDDPALCR